MEAPPTVDAPVDAEARVVETETIVVPPRKADRDWSGRFAFGYVLLGILAVGAFALLGAMIVRANDDGGPVWSPNFEPAGSGLDRANSIAGFVAGAVPPGGRQPARRGAPPASRATWSATRTCRPRASRSSIRPWKATTTSGSTPTNTVQYVLCGLGEGCAIATGDATPERERLVRREALELALYTFKHVDGVDRVATFLPPRAGSPATWMLLFQRDDYRDQLGRPVAQTLPDAVPPAEAIPPDQVETIDGLTKPQRYRFEVQTCRTASRSSSSSPRRPDAGLRLGDEQKAAALARAKARLDTLHLYPRPVRIDGVEDAHQRHHSSARPGCGASTATLFTGTSWSSTTRRGRP